MAGNKFLQGQLNQPVTRPTYTGGKTDSLEVIVNNSTMTITGNVIWDSFIGTTLGTAYSGADGARNYKAILSLTNELNDTVEQFITYKTKTDSRLAAVENIAENVDADITAKLDAEVTRSTESDKELLDKLVKESQRALAAEAEFIHKLETEALLRADVDAELKAEVELLSNSVFDRIHELSTRIDNISGQVKSSETSLIEQITAENLRAVAAEKELQLKLEETNRALASLRAEVSNSSASNKEDLSSSLLALASQINAEVTRAKDQEFILGNKIDAVDSRVTEVALDMSSRIGKVVSDYKAADVEVIDKIDSIDSKHSEDIKNLSTKISSVNNSVTKLELNVKAETARIDNSIVEAVDNLTSKIDTNTNNIEETAVKHDTDIAEIRKELAATEASLTSVVQEESASRASEISRLDAEVTTIIAASVEADKHIATLETVVTQLENKSTVSTIEFNKSIDTLNTAVNSVDTRLQKEIELESNRATLKEDELAEAIVDVTDAFESADKDLDKKIIVVASQLEELKEVTSASSTNAVVSLDALQKSVTDLTNSSNEQFSLLNATDKDIAEQLELLQLNVDGIKNDLTLTSSTIENVSARIEKAEKSIDNHESSLTDVKEVAIQNSDDILSLSQDLQAESSRAVSVENKLSVSVESLKEKVDTIAADQIDYDNKFSLLDATDEQIEEQIRLLKADSDSINDQLTVVQTIQNDLTTEVATNSSQIETVAKNVDDLQQVVDSTNGNIEKVIDGLEGEVIRAELAEKELSSRVDETETELATTKDKVSSLETKQVNLVAQLNSYDSSVTAVNNELTKVNLSIDSIRVDMNKETEKIENALEAVDEKNAAQDAKLEGLTSDVETLQRDVLAHDKKIQSTNQDIAKLKTSVTSVKGAVSTNTSAIASVSSKTDALEAIVELNREKSDKVDAAHTELLNECRETLDSHTGKITQQDKSIAELQSSKIQNSTAIENLYKQLSEETSARQTDVDAVKIQQAKEVKRSTTIDEEHSSRLTKVEDNLLETEDRLSNAITIKENESIARDEYLNEKINNNFDVLDEALQTATSELSANIFDERSDRATGDRALQVQLTTLSNVVTQNDTILSGLSQRVSDESETVDEYITDNDARVLKVEQAVDVLTAESRTHMKTIATESHQVYTQDGTSTIMLPLTQGAEAGAIVKRTEAGNIQLPADVTTIGAADAVPKSYVESLINEMREVLYEEMKSFSFDIIDGGKAPIKK